MSCHVGGEDKRRALALDTEFVLDVTQDMAQIDVEKLTGGSCGKVNSLIWKSVMILGVIYARSMMLSLCLSPMPNIYVATQQPARLLKNTSATAAALKCEGRLSSSHFLMQSSFSEPRAPP